MAWYQMPVWYETFAKKEFVVRYQFICPPGNEKPSSATTKKYIDKWTKRDVNGL